VAALRPSHFERGDWAHTHTHTYIYIYIYVEREKGGGNEIHMAICTLHKDLTEI